MHEIEQEIFDAMLRSLTEFKASNPTETIYAVALVQSASGRWVHCAIATEERLETCAQGYNAKSSLEMVKTWLRWANPDDGWFQQTFDHFGQSNHLLGAAIDCEKLEAYGDDVIELNCRVLGRLRDEDALKDSVVVGLTHGDDPEAFVFYASQLNPKPLVERLKHEFEAGRAVEAEIER
ncbi:MAG: DUF4303 domain-containing protein [Phycisphaerales bacterium]|nr:DUF4303 domain-containing protein [Phycisphaerales bacterium]